eukprot:249044_1
MIMDLLCFSLILAIANSQTNICVWNSIDWYDYLNGEYTLRSEKYDNQNSWERYTPSTCADIGHPGAYVIAAYYALDDLHYWTIHSTLDSNALEVDDYPECGNDWEKFPPTPMDCQLGWQEWADEETYVALPITITAGACPVIDCPFIQIQNSGVDSCDKIYTKSSNSNHKNVFISDDSPRYLYFNIYQFKWFISDTLGIDDCQNDSMLDYYVSSFNDKWKDMTDGKFTMKMDTTNTATFTCLSTTKSPTKAPTVRPTEPPTKRPTTKPTEAPIRPGSPTKAPSLPTLPPTHEPTKTTRTPTNRPSEEPTSNPSEVTEIPTLSPSEATDSPTTKKKKTKKPLMNYDEVNAKKWNTTIQSSVFTISAWMFLACLCVSYIAWRRQYLRKAGKKQRMNESVIASRTKEPASHLSASSMPHNGMVQSRSADSGHSGSGNNSPAPSIELNNAIERQRQKRNQANKKKKKGFMFEEGNAMRIETICSQCAVRKLASEGKRDDADGFWYCFECWEEFYA